MRHFSTAPEEERALALFAVDVVRQNGGVLEHPKASKLWKAKGLPLPGERDSFGGWTYEVEQVWMGHRAAKPTWLYIVGCEPVDAPPFLHSLAPATRCIASARRVKTGRLPHTTKPEREHTPPDFARWLLSLARACRAPSPDMVIGLGQ